ncbi:MAG: dihydrolipoyl dehydrogenase [Candidatus Omnitrophota bacterium]|nr:dihydrolipoyl dehydrogenase [Candidatus Omnitrophota bacterium]MBU1928773.1 dihydrolipoyl dehydrogenase [Candidatus Omnitrophota bacterium]MBU2034228.1 dihydrolipoyl dehydrogenase [Candidatus Omnitrophota bacterium]MBU2258277.1 dihydrolipoyl dehydrogenase [Candidatus Omnitrophota bacterium]
MYDLAIIGSGWAGVNAALKAKELGLNPVIIEKSNLGGACLNQGCIPTKSLIQSAKIYTLAQKSSAFGIDNSGVLSVNLPQIQARKEKIIRQLRQGLEFMLKGVKIIYAPAEFISVDTLKAGSDEIQAKAILIASGSVPLELKSLKFDNNKVVSSNEILNLKELPASILIIGAGVIGCEFASLFSNLGVRVKLVELTPQVLPEYDLDVANRIKGLLEKKGVEINTSTNAADINLQNFDLVLVCIGRIPMTAGLGVEKVGVILEGGRIKVDQYLKTNIPNIYAAGDCIGQAMLAHYAAYQGKCLAVNLASANELKKAVSSNIPSCVFTDPEIASTGLSEEGARKAGFEVKIYKRDFISSGMAKILSETDGFMKIISDKKSGKLLGSSIVGPRATELISILVLAIDNNLTVNQLRGKIFPHPTLSELITETLMG